MWDSQLRRSVLIDVRRAHFESAARRKVFGSFLQKPARTRANLDVCSEACVAAETLE